MKWITVAGAAFTALSFATFAEAASTEELQCLAAKEKALAKYESCVWKAHAKAAIKGTAADTLSCETKFDEAWVKPNDKFGDDCPSVSAETIRGMFDAHVDEVMPEIESALDQCSVHSQDCPDGQGCYPSGFGPEDTVCLTAGTTPEGGACLQQNHCMEGYMCANNGSGNQCREICQPSDPQCSTPGQTCVALGTLNDTGACF